MTDRKPIVFVATYEHLRKRAEAIVRKNDFPIEVIRGNLETFDYILERISCLEAEVVICRGGTYQMLREQLPLPMVELRISAYDILKSCGGVTQLDKPIAFVGFRNVMFGADVLASVLDRPIRSAQLDKSEPTEVLLERIRALADDGIEYFVGDYIGAHMARDLGYPAGLVESDDDSILQAMREAMNLLEVTMRERTVAQRYRIIMDSIENGILSLDRYSDLPVLNRAAQEYCLEHHLSPANLANTLGLDAGDVKQGMEVHKLPDHSTLSVSRSPVTVGGEQTGVVATFQDVSLIQKMEQKIRTELAAKGLTAKYTFSDILRRSRVMEHVVDTAKKFALSEATVLIQAQTGTGKELFAQSIHNASRRAGKPFVAINCAALPENLLESELFGYADGAFTGAKKGGRTGLFELAHKGTIFLDEIGDMPLNLQSRLLRVIQEKEVMRIGAEKIIPIDVRIIASTNLSLEQSVGEGRFREDLYYRLNILSLCIPPLNERPEDIQVLARHLMNETAQANHKQISGIESDAMEALMRHQYHGNVRELRGMIERAVVIADGETITRADLDIRCPKERFPMKEQVLTTEQELIRRTLSECGGNASEAARRLGIDRSTLYRKMRKP